MMKKKYIFFDLDGTLTESRRVIESSMKSALQALLVSGKTVIVISGAAINRISLQLEDMKNIITMAQCGNSCAHWENIIPERQKDMILQHIYSIKIKYPFLFLDVNPMDIIDDRGCGITFSLVGHHAAMDRKKKFDPTGGKRQSMLKDVPFIGEGVQIQIGGTTSFDYIIKTKGQNIKDFMDINKWEKDECLYVGDALYENGNDSSVIGVMDTKSTSGPKETLQIIKDILK